MTNYQISIDLGTTTLAFSDALHTAHTAPNHQSAFGADVISRIQASCNGHAPLLQKIIQDDLIQGIHTIKTLSHIPESAPLSIAIAANTTMVHLLMGYSCNGLASFPFTPVTLEQLEVPGDFLSLPGKVTLFPGASAFIGGDVLSGLLFLNADTWEKPCLLLDLGTNGEMVLGTKASLLAASTAAGPALEGGGILCGAGGIKGAVCHFSLDRVPSFQTIDYGRPVGICGTGIIDLTAELLSHGKMDETGLLTEPYFTQGFPVTKAYGNQKALTFTQADVRQVQMAKSAIYTGIVLLCKEYGISFQEIDKVFLAGALGTQIDTANAARIGLFPKELLEKIQPAGNTSLAGASVFLSQKESSKRRLENLQSALHCLELANLPQFQELYISHINFSNMS